MYHVDSESGTRLYRYRAIRKPRGQKPYEAGDGEMRALNAAEVRRYVAWRYSTAESNVKVTWVRA